MPENITINVGGAAAAGETKAPEAKAPEPVKLEPTDDNLPEVVETKEPEAAVETADKPDIIDPEAGDELDKPKKPIPGSQRHKLRAERLAGELAERDREIFEMRRASQPGDASLKPGIERAPKEEDFPSDYFAYQSAMTAWNVLSAIRSQDAQKDATRQRAARYQARMDLVEEYSEAVQEVKERITDYDDVVSKAVNHRVPDELADEIMSAGKKAPLITYYLAQHPEKLAELSQMTGRELAREVGRLESRLHLPQAKKATDATPPPTQVKGGATPTFDPFKTDDMNAYVAFRKKEMAASR